MGQCSEESQVADQPIIDIAYTPRCILMNLYAEKLNMLVCTAYLLRI